MRFLHPVSDVTNSFILFYALSQTFLLPVRALLKSI